MKIKRLVLGICLTMLSGNMVFAQQETDTSAMMLSLEEAKAVAMEHNRTLKNASLDVQKAEAARWQSIASMLPQVSGSLNYQNMCGYEMELGGMNIAMPPSGTFGISASVAISGAQIVSTHLGTIAMDMAIKLIPFIYMVRNGYNISTSVIFAQPSSVRLSLLTAMLMPMALSMVVSTRPAAHV